MAELPDTISISVNVPATRITPAVDIEAISVIGIGTKGPPGPQPVLSVNPTVVAPYGTPPDVTVIGTTLTFTLPNAAPPTATAWADITGKPTFSTVATSGNYSDLLGKPTLFSGAYDDLTNKPSTFPPAAHTHTVADLSDASANGRSWLQAASYAAMKALLSLVKGDVGLANVDNTSDVNKPVSNATQTALNGKASTSHTHLVADLSDASANGRSWLQAANYAAMKLLLSLTKSDVGLANVPNVDSQNASNLNSGTVASARLPATADTNARTAVKKGGVLVGTRRGLNLIQGTNITLTVADDSANEEVDVTIASTGGSTIPFGGEVGAYAFLQNNSGNDWEMNSTATGSTLLQAALNSSSSLVTSNSMSGTWQACQRCYAYQTSLWVRIA